MCLFAGSDEVPLMPNSFHTWKSTVPNLASRPRMATSPAGSCRLNGTQPISPLLLVAGLHTLTNPPATRGRHCSVRFSESGGHVLLSCHLQSCTTAPSSCPLLQIALNFHATVAQMLICCTWCEHCDVKLDTSTVQFVLLNVKYKQMN